MLSQTYPMGIQADPQRRAVLLSISDVHSFALRGALGLERFEQGARDLTDEEVQISIAAS